jgi:hypothetical protein
LVTFENINLDINITTVIGKQKTKKPFFDVKINKIIIINEKDKKAIVESTVLFIHEKSGTEINVKLRTRFIITSLIKD